MAIIRTRSFWIGCSAALAVVAGGFTLMSRSVDAQPERQVATSVRRQVVQPPAIPKPKKIRRVHKATPRATSERRTGGAARDTTSKRRENNQRRRELERKKQSPPA